jgi:hypothetical protein
MASCCGYCSAPAGSASHTADRFVTAIPYVVGASGMYLFGRRSDAGGERRFHLAGAAATAGVALIVIPYVGLPAVTLLVLCAARLGNLRGAADVFRQFPRAFSPVPLPPLLLP